MKPIDLFKRHEADLVANQWIAVIDGKHQQIGVRTDGVDYLTDEGRELAGKTGAADLAAAIAAPVAETTLASVDLGDAEASEKDDIIARLLALGEPKPGSRTGLPKLRELLAAAEANFSPAPIELEPEPEPDEIDPDFDLGLDD